MADIARLAGVSRSAVSFALNNRAGVSLDTRRRVLAIAEELGWFPNVAARALSGATVGAIGLVLTRPPRSLGAEPFYMSFLAGIESVFSTHGSSLLMHIASSSADEIATYRRWAAERRVDGLILIDLRVNDPRPQTVRELGLPAVVVAQPRYAGGLACVWSADAEAVTSAVDRLVELGHRQLARVSERPDMAHSATRTQAFLEACSVHGVPAPYLVETDASGDSGQEATRQLLKKGRRPTAILYDNDVMAVAGLGAVREMGLRVPEDVSLLAYDDSLLCEITQPALAALAHDVYNYGAHTADLLLRQIASDDLIEGELDTVPQLIERGSIGSAPAP
ncbi:LacI family DNA-binding transcriptional regulator [Okibacterium endophyticum]